MFGFIARRRLRKSRGLFGYFDGIRQRAADPLEVLALIESDPNWRGEIDGPLVDAGDNLARQNLVSMVERAFDVKAWSEQTPGLTVAERVQLFVAFSRFVLALKKNTAQKPNWRPSSALATASPASSGMTTAAIADSSSISPSPNGVSQTPSG